MRWASAMRASSNSSARVIPPRSAAADEQAERDQDDAAVGVDRCPASNGTYATPARAARAGRVRGARRLVRNPTGRVRLATLRLLERTPEGVVQQAETERDLAQFLAPAPGADPLRAPEELRAVTLR